MAGDDDDDAGVDDDGARAGVLMEATATAGTFTDDSLIENKWLK